MNDLIPQEKEMQILQTMAKNALQSKFFDKLANESGILSIMLYARELGLAPFQCIMGGMHNIQGKIELSARLMNSMIRKAGHRIDIIESSNSKCILKGIRKDTEESCTVSFSIDDAKMAGVYKDGGGWTKWPSDMCFARALSRLARRLFADVIGTTYVEGELSDQKEEKHEPRAFKEAIDVEPEPIELVKSEVKKPEHCISMQQSCELYDMVKDDAEWRKNCFEAYSKAYGYEVKDFIDLPAAQYEPLKKKIVAYKSMQTPEYMNG